MQELFSRTLKLMGNRFVITVSDMDAKNAESNIDKAVDEIRRIENLLTTFSENSQTFRIKRTNIIDK